MIDDSTRRPAAARAVTSAVILLHRNDNVVVCRRAVAAGETIVIDGGGGELIAASDVEMGHKLARVRIPQNAKVVKYGAPIGSMTRAAEAGEWVHLHNMKSDYLNAHTRAATGEDK